MTASLGHVIFTAAGIFHLPRCEECMYGNCMPNGEWHTWAGNEDLDYAAANGQDVEAILKQRCACQCEDSPASPELPDELDYLMGEPAAPCTECGETTACATDYEGRPLFHRQTVDEDT
jgi:hypothetical protein